MSEGDNNRKFPEWPWGGLVLSAFYIFAVFSLPCFPLTTVGHSSNRQPHVEETQNATGNRPERATAVVQSNATHAKQQREPQQSNNSDCIACRVWAALGRFITDLGDPVALFTGLLVVVSTFQGALILRAEGATREALRISKQQADAADLAARNMLRATRPRIILEAMKIGDFTGLVPKVELAKGEALQCIYGTFRNQGTATGFIGDFCISTNMGKFGPPLSPDSEESEPLFFGAVELKSDDIFSPTARLTWVALETVPKNYFRTLKVWGWVRYTDIHGIKRRSGFGFSYFRMMEADETPGVFLPQGGTRYWYDVEED